MTLAARRRRVRLRNRFLQAVELMLFPIRFVAAFAVALAGELNRKSQE